MIGLLKLIEYSQPGQISVFLHEKRCNMKDTFGCNAYESFPCDFSGVNEKFFGCASYEFFRRTTQEFFGYVKSVSPSWKVPFLRPQRALPFSFPASIPSRSGEKILPKLLLF